MEAIHRQEDIDLMLDPQPANVLDSVRISGFRSLRDVELSDLPVTCVLLGQNGSGKTNLIRFFEMLSHGIGGAGIGEYLLRNGGADANLHCGKKVTAQIRGEIGIRSDDGRSEYRFTLAHADPDRLVFTEEAYRFLPANARSKTPWNALSSDGHDRARIAKIASYPAASDGVAARRITKLLGNLGVYQFRDVSQECRIGMDWDADDGRRMRSDGRNLAAVIYGLERDHPKSFRWISGILQREVKAFDRFHLENRDGKVRFGWKALGSDRVYGHHDTSDGSLRLFALFTLLELPKKMLPKLVLLDEPDLGLHHCTHRLLGGTIRSHSVNRQIIATTQSTSFLEEFELNQAVVMEADASGTVVKRYRNDSFHVASGERQMTARERYEMGYL